VVIMVFSESDENMLFYRVDNQGNGYYKESILKKLNAIIVDLDGCIFNVDHRLPYVDGSNGSQDWSTFEGLTLNDSVNEWVADIVRMFDQSSYCIFVLTGRRSYLRKVTEKQLTLHKIPYHALIMKDADDIRTACQFKEEHLIRIVNHYKVKLAIEDEKDIVEMYQKHNVSVLHKDPQRSMPWETSKRLCASCNQELKLTVGTNGYKWFECVNNHTYSLRLYVKEGAVNQ
jgi:hypothetical protein